MKKRLRDSENGQSRFLGVAAFASLICSSPAVFGATCEFEGEYRWNEQGTTFLNAPPGAPGVSLVEVGRLSATANHYGSVAGQMRGTSEATFYFPFSPLASEPQTQTLSVHVRFGYAGGYRINNEICAGRGSWKCEVKEVFSAAATNFAIDPETQMPMVEEVNLLKEGDPAAIKSALNGFLCELPGTVDFTFNAIENERLDFIITTRGISSSGTAVRVGR